MDVRQGRLALGVELQMHTTPLDGPLRTDTAEDALCFLFGLVQQGQAPFERGQATGDRAGDFGQALDGGHQHQHGGDEGDKSAHGGTRCAILALVQRNHQHHGQRQSRHDLCQRGHGGRGHGGFECQPTQHLGQFAKTGYLMRLPALQSNHPVRQHVFLNHIGQVVGRCLAFLGQFVKAPAQGLDDPAQARGHSEHHQGEFPVEPHQVAEQGDQREAVTCQGNDGRHQLRGAGLDFVNNGVGQGAGRLFGKQGQIGLHELGKQLRAEFFHAIVGQPGQRVLGNEVGDAAHREQADHCGWNGPERKLVFGKPLVQQGLKQGRDHRLGQGGHQGARNRHSPDASLISEIGQQSLQPGPDAGCRHGRERGQAHASIVRKAAEARDL